MAKYIFTIDLKVGKNTHVKISRTFVGVAEKDLTSIFSGHKTGVNCLAFSTDGLILVSGGKVIFSSRETLKNSGFCYYFMGYCK